MKLSAESRGGRRATLLAGAVSFAMLAVLAIAARAQATETIYWDNFRDKPATIGSADISGNGGGLLNLGGLQFHTTEGMAYDPVTNRLYVAVEALSGGKVLEEGAIAVINLDGSGASYFSAPGLVADAPEGIVIDPATRMMYWDNVRNDSIGWANLDGSAAGTLNVSGAAAEGYFRLALDPGSGRLFWPSKVGAKPVISWAGVNNTGGGILPGAISMIPDGLATDPLTKRLYMISGTSTNGTMESMALDGGAIESVPLTTGFNSGYGLAIDPVSKTAYWGNYGLIKTQTEAIGFAALSGSPGGAISIATTPVNSAQDPVIVRSPTGTGAPQITQSKAALTCSQGTWAPDYAGGFVYQAPTSYSYQWLLNGQPVAGATAATFTATTAGSYSCSVTGKNPTGTATQTSAAATVTTANLSVSLKSKKVRARAGKAAIVKFKIANGGDFASTAIKLCAKKLTKKAKKGLRAPKCASVKPIASGGSVVATLRVKTKNTANGAYRFTTQVKGAKVKAVTVNVKVLGAKKH